MKWLNSHRMKLMLVGIMVTLVVGGGSAKADFTFGEATNLGPVINTTSNEWAVCLSPDGLEMYFISDRPGGSGDFDIWLTTRVTIYADWDPPENLGPMINSPGTEFSAGISSDGLTLYFNSDRAGSDGLDLWKSTRVHKNDLWTTPINLGPIVNSQYWESTATISADGLELYFLSDRPGGLGGSYGDIWLTTRTSLEEPWAEPVNPSILNSAHNEGLTCLSPDGLTIFFDSDRPGGIGDWDIWFSRRRTLQDVWSKPTNLGSTINTTYFEGMGPLAPDGRTLYFISTRPGGLGGDWGDIWQVPIIPVVDLNADGIVDAADMIIIVDHWDTDDPLCDIGSMPWGDGIVDVQDLIVLAEHLFEEIPPSE